MYDECTSCFGGPECKSRDFVELNRASPKDRATLRKATTHRSAVHVVLRTSWSCVGRQVVGVPLDAVRLISMANFGDIGDEISKLIAIKLENFRSTI